MTTAHVGKPVSRVDGRAKVSGTAKYAAEYSATGLVHGVVVSSDAVNAVLELKPVWLTLRLVTPSGT